MNPKLKKNLSSTEYWFRAIYVIVFLVLAKIAGFIVLMVALVQIVITLLTGSANIQLIRFGDSLSKYLFALFNFVMCKSEDKPFPFADWPEADPIVQLEPVKEDASVNTEASVDAEPEVNAPSENLQKPVVTPQQPNETADQVSAPSSEVVDSESDPTEKNSVPPETDKPEFSDEKTSEPSVNDETDPKKTKPFKED